MHIEKILVGERGGGQIDVVVTSPTVRVITAIFQDRCSLPISYSTGN